MVEELRWNIEPVRYANGYHAHTSVVLPVSAQELRFVAAGSQMGGHFEVSRTGARGSDEVLVDIQAIYRREQALQNVTVFHLSSRNNEHEVNISRRTAGYQPDLTGIYQTIQFHIYVRLPFSSAPQDAGVLRMNALSTSLPLFSHYLLRFGDSLQFDRIALETSNSRIEAEFLVARAVSLTTSNGEVCGTFKTHELLQVDTSNARVSVDAYLISGGEREVSQLVLQTSNGPIQANISLGSGTSPATGSFDIVAHTINGGVTVAFVEQAADSRLTASLQTMNAPASVKMHPAFEGQFELRSSFFLPPSVNEGRISDPAGLGRVRTITKHGIGPGAMVGNVSWGAGAGHVQRDGRVEVQTMNAPLRFSL